MFFRFEPEFIALIACRLKDLPCFIQLVFDVGGRIGKCQKLIGVAGALCLPRQKWNFCGHNRRLELTYCS